VSAYRRGELERTRSSPTGPAEQEEGGSLQGKTLVSIAIINLESCKGSSKSLDVDTDVGDVGGRNPAHRCPPHLTAFEEQAVTGGNGQGNSLPTQIGEFLVDALQSHLDVREIGGIKGVFRLDCLALKVL
jgi:hypothetical protein